MTVDRRGTRKGVRLTGALAALAVLGSTLAACSSPPAKSGSTPGTTAPLKAAVLYAHDSNIGTVLVVGYGSIVYATTAESKNHVSCTGACTKTWLPIATSGKPVNGGGLERKLMGTVTRPDGSLQATYAGHPLYVYRGQKTGLLANAQGSGGVWFAVLPDGALLHG